jgi:hypothetical protein
MLQRKNLGECVVVAHVMASQEQGHDVILLIGDHCGRTTAVARGLVYAAIKDVLALAMHAGCFATLPNPMKAYGRLQ